jgi:hypothetical protein
MAAEEPAAADTPPAPEPEPEDGTAAGAEDEAGAEEENYRDALRDPLDGAGGLGGGGTSRLRHGRTFDRAGSVISLDSTIVNQVTLAVGDPLVAGRIPAEELDRRCRLFDEVAGLDAMTERLRKTRVVVLCGEPNSGRMSTGVVLLRNAVPDGRDDGPVIIRLEPDTDLAQLPADGLEAGAGYLAEPVPPVDRPPLTELHLDRLSGILADRGSYAVVLVSDPAEQASLLRGRYGLRFRPPSSDGVLRRHLAELLAAEPEATRTTVQEWGGAEDVTLALGIGDLRPGEAVRLAALLVDHQRGALDRPALLRSCSEFAATQVATWFRPIDGRLDRGSAIAAARVAAFRITLAVYDGSSYAVVAEAADLLGRRLVALLDPEEPLTLPLFADDPLSRTLAARAVIADGLEALGDRSVPVKQIRYTGPVLGQEVLRHVWSNHHGVRGAMVDWLRELSRNHRPELWIPAADACGLLAQLDLSYAVGELIVELAKDPDAQLRLVAAAALNSAAADPALAGAIGDLVRRWGRGTSSALAWTAAVTYSFGRVGGSTSAALREIARIGTVEDNDLRRGASWSAVQLLGAVDPGEVLAQLLAWAHDDRPDRRVLAALASARLAMARTDDVLTGQDRRADEVASWAVHPAYPLALMLAETDEEWAAMTADLIWELLGPPSTGPFVESSIRTWARGAVERPDQADALCRFLPRLVRSPGDANLLWNVVDSLVCDPDEPLPVPLARTLSRSLRGASR